MNFGEKAMLLAEYQPKNTVGVRFLCLWKLGAVLVLLVHPCVG